ncbi:hypothetical protein V8C86DRAFT_3032053, partial [Haematococcus lacustris]
MTAVELMVAAQQWSAITRAMPTAKPSVKPAAATADGPTIRKRGRPLGSRNKPKPPVAQATPTPTRKQARLVCSTSSSANSSSASNSSGDNSSSEDGSANNEEWVVNKLAAGVADCKKSAVGVVEVLEPWRIDMVCKCHWHLLRHLLNTLEVQPSAARSSSQEPTSSQGMQPRDTARSRSLEAKKRQLYWGRRTQAAKSHGLTVTLQPLGPFPLTLPLPLTFPRHRSPLPTLP